ncbi:MAG: hypothetical protein WAK93_20080 [Solirubrobacteraceae bacterium]
MTYRFSAVATARTIATVIILAGALALLGTHVLGAQAKPAGHASSAKAASASIVNQDFGSDGARGHFSATLSPGAHVMAAVMSMVSGVPYTKIAKGGSYIAKIAPSSEAGLAVVSFSDRALGKACVQWSGKSGTFDPTKGFLAVSGSLKMIGGTGAAARWRGSLKFKQTGLTGSDTLQVGTLVSVSTGAKHGLTKACKAVTKLKG